MAKPSRLSTDRSCVPSTILRYPNMKARTKRNKKEATDPGERFDQQ